MASESDQSADDDRFRTVSQFPGSAAPGDDSFPRSQDTTAAGVPGGGRVDSSHVSIGERIGRYEITGAFGAGGMGVVFKAHDTAIDRTVAIKVLSTPIAANGRITTSTNDDSFSSARTMSFLASPMRSSKISFGSWARR
jgi:serine/threonine protein kinase